MFSLHMNGKRVARMRGIHLITNGISTNEDLKKLANIHNYFHFIHLREKTKTAAELLEMVEFIQMLGVPLSKVIINDRVDIAVLKKCGGVQLAYHSLPVTLVRSQFPDLKIGKSVHTVKEAMTAESDGSDFVLFGHIYRSQSKQGLPPRGISALHKLAKSISIPVIAVGGIKPDHVEEVLESGAKGIAMISAIWEASVPEYIAKEYYDRFNQWEEEHHERSL
ncbi:thiazole tautomerase (transcriptional regulator TenI) [Gracilibacillus ureilyticus]|uniref:Thiazole tautomerase (Transcriptional regulator TenI) n=1 Tax=Gracilibacillus ureilyticus TaxID=531814 RepID=A0A1H9SKM4_9BACI|nr:thiamine phosphate synthase [Gracilibacillus ureilyticus]SER85566.1 thiazole tautomerase (transcriptional regulator TenI) [Gracilibacillus ureilyticus]